MITWDTMVWEDDKDDVKHLAQKQWDKLALGNIGELDIDMELMWHLYQHAAFVGLVGRNEEGEIIGYFVGVVEPFIFQKGKFSLQQITTAIKDGDMRDYVNMINAVEKEAIDMGANIVVIAIESIRAGEIMKNKCGYEFNDCTLLKRLN